MSTSRVRQSWPEFVHPAQDRPAADVNAAVDQDTSECQFLGLKMDPLPGQRVTGALNWALDIRIPRTLVKSPHASTTSRHRRVLGGTAR